MIIKTKYGQVEWTWEPPRRRTLRLNSGGLYQWDAPGLAFAVYSFGETHRHKVVPRVLAVYGADEAPTSDDSMIFEIYISGGNIVAWGGDVLAHKMHGFVCLSPQSGHIARGMPPVEAFWMSGFTFIPQVSRHSRMTVGNLIKLVDPVGTAAQYDGRRNVQHWWFA